MTYRELWQKIIDMPNSELDSDVTVYDSVMDEYLPVASFNTANDDGVLDAGHYVLRTVLDAE